LQRLESVDLEGRPDYFFFPKIKQSGKFWQKSTVIFIGLAWGLRSSAKKSLVHSDIILFDFPHLSFESPK
jgi:hypothetical protein